MKKYYYKFCFKLPNWFVFFQAQISCRSWWKRTHWQRWKKKKRKWKRRKKELGCKFIRINPDAESYDIFVEIGKIKDYIARSNKKNEIKEIKKLEKEKEAEIKEIKE